MDNIPLIHRIFPKGAVSRSEADPCVCAYPDATKLGGRYRGNGMP